MQMGRQNAGDVCPFQEVQKRNGTLEQGDETSRMTNFTWWPRKKEEKMQ